jgi:urea carboxylase
MRFRDRHQDPESTDIEYSARVNGLASVEELIQRHSGTPWFISMVGFISGDPFMYQMVERDAQIQNPKYLKPRLDTPKQAVVHGGCFTGIHPVASPGGYQVIGITPLPIYDTSGQVDYLREEMILFSPGDIVKFRPIDRAEYDRIVTEVEQGEYRLHERPITFALEDFRSNPAENSARLIEALYVN